VLLGSFDAKRSREAMGFGGGTWSQEEVQDGPNASGWEEGTTEVSLRWTRGSLEKRT
jgi:hypothetical protein